MPELQVHPDSVQTGPDWYCPGPGKVPPALTCDVGEGLIVGCIQHGSQPHYGRLITLLILHANRVHYVMVYPTSDRHQGTQLPEEGEILVALHPTVGHIIGVGWPSRRMESGFVWRYIRPTHPPLKV